MENPMKIEKIWQAYSNNLKQYLEARLYNKADVDDLLQEILIKTHKQINTLETNEKLLPWLYKITQHTLIDHYRKKAKQSEHPREEDLWYSEQGDKQGQQTELTMSTCVLPFVEQLPESTAYLIKSIDIEGRSQKELAAELSISYSGLKSRVQRGRKALRLLFESCCHLEFDRYGNVIDYEPKTKHCQRHC